MSQTINIINVLLVGILFVSLWIFYFWFYRDYCIDRTRQKLFAIRDELFDFAADGNISFDDPAYGFLRRSLNGVIRFTYKIDLINVIMLYVVKPTKKVPPPEDLFKHIESEETRKRLKIIFIKMNIIVFTHLIKVSIPMMFFAAILSVFIIASHGWRNLKMTLANKFPGVKQIEDYAAIENPC